MSRQQLIDEFRHGVQGVWLDVLLRTKEGAEFSIALRLAQKKTDTLSAALYDQAAGVVPNGTPAQPQGVKK